MCTVTVATLKCMNRSIPLYLFTFSHNTVFHIWLMVFNELFFRSTAFVLQAPQACSRHRPAPETAVRWRACLHVSKGWAIACQPDGLLLVRVLSLPVVVLWSAWWLMTALQRPREADTGSPCMSVDVERVFTCCTGGPFEWEGAPPPIFTPIHTLPFPPWLVWRGGEGERKGVWGDMGGWKRTEREVRHGALTDTLWQDLFRRHRHPIWPLWVDHLHQENQTQLPQNDRTKPLMCNLSRESSSGSFYPLSTSEISPVSQ